jgi:hypothetical protein
MEIVIKGSSDDYGMASEALVIDGKEVESVFPLCECPEDAIIGRALISCSDIAKYMQMAYEIGKSGQPMTVRTEQE